MKRQMLLPLLILASSSVAVAQSSLRVMDSILFKTDAQSDAPIYRAFGISGDCTDGYDFEHEVLVPTFPPFSFFVAFTPEDLLPRPYADLMQNDCRGIPDSVGNGSAKTFWIDYELRFEGGTGQHVSIVFPARLARGIDSLRLQDVEGLGNIFTFVYSGDEQPKTFEIPNTEIRYVMLRVYYNVQTAAVPTGPLASLSNLHIAPNPARPGQTVRLNGDVPAGASLVVRDVLGRAIQQRRLAETTRTIALNIEDEPAGVYFLQLISGDGAILYSDRLVVAR